MRINDLADFDPVALRNALPGSLGCMGGWCAVRERCPVHARRFAEVILERACHTSNDHVGLIVCSNSRSECSLTSEMVCKDSLTSFSTPRGVVRSAGGAQRKNSPFPRVKFSISPLLPSS